MVRGVASVNVAADIVADLAAYQNKAKPWLRGPDLTDRILARKDEPWLSLRIGEREVARVPLRALVTLTGASGAGKSSWALQVGAEHARNVGPTVYLTIELDEVEAAARVAGQRCGEAWEDVLRGRVAVERMRAALDLPRMFVLEGKSATVGNMNAAAEAAITEYPGQPVLVVVDYLQLLHSDDEADSERTRVAYVIENLRETAKRLRVVILDLSQTSRVSAKGLRDGEIVGADTTATGAESSQIERASYVTLALGAVRDEEDGTKSVDLSIGKSRMGGGDVVIPMRFDGRIGTFEVAGDPVAGSKVRAEKASARAEQKEQAREARIDGLDAAIKKVLAEALAPMTRDQLRHRVGKGANVTSAAVRRLLEDPTSEVVEVRQKLARSPSWKLWNRERAAAAGVAVVGDDQ